MWVSVPYLTLGDKASATEHLRQALALVRSNGNRADEASVLMMLGSAYESSQESKPAVDIYQQALALCRTQANRQCDLPAGDPERSAE